VKQEVLTKCEALISFLKTLDEDDLGTNFKVPFLKPENLLLPEDYIFFMNWSNGIFILGIELLGIVNEKFNLLSHVQREQNETNNLMPKYIIPFAPVGNGDYYCFDIKDGLKDGICPVIYWQWDYSSPDDYEVLADSFVDWLAFTINEMMEEEE
jgi:hypothetical protein